MYFDIYKICIQIEKGMKKEMEVYDLTCFFTVYLTVTFVSG
jgi:hypothetical protein